MVGQVLLVAVAIILGFLYDATVWGRSTTVAFPFFVTVAILGGGFGLQWLDQWHGDPLPHRPFPANGSVWLAVPPVVFSTIAWLTAIQPGAQNSLRYWLSLGFTFLYLALLAMTYVGGRLANYSLFDYLINFYHLAVGIVQLPVQMVHGWIEQARQGAGADHVSVVYSRWVAILGFLALVGLLGLANSVFWHVYNDWLHPFSGEARDVNFLRALLWSYLILGCLLYAGTHSQNALLTTDPPNLPIYFHRWLNYDRSILVFIAMIIPVTAFTVLRFFVVIDPRHYLNEIGMPAWINERFGFWYLVLAALVVFLIICWLDHVTLFQQPNYDLDRLVHSIANFYLFLNVGVMLWTAAFGVSLQVFGFTARRHIFQAQGALAWMVIMFSMFVFFEFIEQEGDYPINALLVTTGMILLFTSAGLLFGQLW